MAESSASSIGGMVVELSGDLGKYAKMWEESVSIAEKSAGVITEVVVKETKKTTEMIAAEHKKQAAAAKIHGLELTKNMVEEGTRALTAREIAYTKEDQMRSRAYQQQVAQVAQTGQQMKQAVTTATTMAAQSNVVYLTNFQRSMQGVKHEFSHIMEHMTHGVRGFSAQGLAHGMLHMVGFASGAMAIHHAFGFVIGRMGEANRLSEEMVRKNTEVEKSYRSLHKVITETMIAKQGLYGQVESRAREVEEAQKALDDIGREIDATGKERLTQSTSSWHRVQEDMIETLKAMFSTDNEAGNKMMARIVKDAEIRKKYHVGILDFQVHVNEKILAAEDVLHDKQSKLLEDLANKRKALLAAETALAKAAGRGLPGGASQADVEAEREKERGKDQERAMRALQTGLAAQEKAYDALVEAQKKKNTESERERKHLDDLAQRYRELGDPIEKAKKEMEELYSVMGRMTAGQFNYAADQINKGTMGKLGLESGNPTAKDRMREVDEQRKHLQNLHTLHLDYFAKNVEAQRKYTEKIKELERSKRNIALQEMSLHLRAAESMADSLASIAMTLGGKQSAAYKLMFTLSKTAAIAQATIAMYQSAAEAMKLGWPAGIAAAAAALAQGASIVSNIAAVRLAGFAGGGRTPYAPRSGGMDGMGGYIAMLHPEEKIVDLKDKNSGSGTTMTVNVINQAGAEVEAVQRDDKTLEIIVRKVNSDIALGVRSGGGPVALAIEQTYKLRRGQI